TDPSKAAQQLLGTTDSITQGTSLDATNVMGSVAYSATLGTMLEERYKKDDDKEMYHYLKNNGGADQVAMNTVKKINAYVGSEDGNKQLIGIFGSAFEKNGEKVEFNTEKFKELAAGAANGSLSYDDLKAQADAAM
ncbi:hypothetical protein, partial [Bacillus thuringiensis]|uniref:hypothetical protein n=1 Tax=Bacillus thuringiensis TaxID=1428 RepID=UPI003887005E